MAEESEVNFLEKEKSKLEYINATEDGDEVDNENNGTNALLRQIIGVSGMTFLVVTGSMVAGYSAILLPQLQIDEYNIRLNKDQESWIASMAPLQMALGSIFSSWSMDKFGPKRLNLFCCCLAVAGWMFIYLAESLSMLLIGRIVCGIYVGLSTTSTTAYIGELADTKYRGLFLSFVAFGIAFGVLVVHILGTYLTWKTTAFIAMSLPLISFAIIAYLPESHVWLTNQGRFNDARKSFYWFKGTGENARNEMQKFLSSYTKERSSSKSRTLLETVKEFRLPEVYKPLLVLNIFFTTTQLSGTNVVSFYSVSLMQSTVPGLHKYAAMIIVDAIRVVMSVVASILTSRFKVRPLVFVSAIGSVFSLFALSLTVYLAHEYPDHEVYTTIPIIFLVSYIIFISIGMVPLPWTLCGEILPPTMKGVGGGLSTSVNFLTFFAVIKTSPAMFEVLGTYGTFLTYGICVLLGTIILYFILPETKDRSFDQIRDDFKAVSRKTCDKS